MIKNIKVIKIHEKEIISFNDETQLVIVDGAHIYNLNYKAMLLGVIENRIILFVENSYIISIDFPSFLPGVVLFKGTIDAHTNSDKNIWVQRKNQIFCIGPELNLTPYDEFDSVTLHSIVYLHELNTLACFVQDEDGYKIFFENSNIPTLSFPGIFSLPELFFESNWGVIFFVGRTKVEYDFQYKKLKTSNRANPIKFSWKSLELTLNYQITSTAITIDDEQSKITQIEGDVWKVINTGNTLYLFSDSINTPICMHSISTNGHIQTIYTKKHSSHQIEVQQNDRTKSCPMMVLLPERKCKDNKTPTAIFFIHGGPHQKAGNLWDPLLSALLSNKYPVYVPQYKGTVGVNEDKIPFYGSDDFASLVPHYDQVRQEHSKIMIIGHSYGAFLALKLFFQRYADILIGINGVYDLLTISHLNPKTYSHLHKDVKTSHSPKHSPKSPQRNCEWHHIQFTKDPLIQNTDLMGSLERIGGEGPKIHYLNLRGHGTFSEFQSAKIVEKIKSIESQFYSNSPMRTGS